MYRSVEIHLQKKMAEVKLPWLVVALLVLVQFRVSLFAFSRRDLRVDIADLHSALTALRCWDDFRSPYMVFFNWKKRLFYLRLLLSLCGDIHFNPGRFSMWNL